jgi:hypothetical protein
MGYVQLPTNGRRYSVSGWPGEGGNWVAKPYDIPPQGQGGRGEGRRGLCHLPYWRSSVLAKR